jgi:hypothetical protein
MSVRHASCLPRNILGFSCLQGALEAATRILLVGRRELADTKSEPAAGPCSKVQVEQTVSFVLLHALRVFTRRMIDPVIHPTKT